MQSYASLADFLKRGRAELKKGPIALVFAEDDVVLSATIEHLSTKGFAKVIVLLGPGVPQPARIEALNAVIVRDVPTDRPELPQAVTRIQAAAPDGTWFHWCYNAEFLFYPFSEHRQIGEMLSFHSEERRPAMIGFAIDLYAPDLTKGSVDLHSAMLDRSGYYALSRSGPDGQTLDRQMDFFGGLRRRFEEHVPYDRRRIDRVALFRSRTKGLEMRADGTFSEDEYNTYQCPWHHNLTCTLVSFRAAKALTQNPGSRRAIKTFHWHNSVPFEWSSRQLMDLGLMEPGQWF